MREGTYRSNDDTTPLVRVEPCDGRARVTVIDGGDPAAYHAHAMLGASGAAHGGREGFGIGRLRIRLIAEYLGYSVTHRPLLDGSGSAIEIEMLLATRK